MPPECTNLAWTDLGGLVLLQALLASTQAAVTSAITGDGTLGTTVTRSGTIHTITGGTRPGNGPNLFHSFDRFSVGTGDTARFSGPTVITNILSRVTGGEPSVIDGRLQSTVPGANLYLLNPSGVLFSSKATLSVSGSFHVSTADFLRLADGAKFFANLGQESRLTVAEPAAFGFLGSTPAPITMQGSGLGVLRGRALSVVGGDITLAGGILQALSGRMQLASVASPGEVVFSPLELAPDLQVDSFARLGRIAVSEGAIVTVSSPAQVPMSSRPGAGTVIIRGGRLLVDNAFVNANTTGAGEGARLGIDVRLAEDLVFTNGSQLIADSRGAGRAGDLRLKAGSVYIENASILSRASASGETAHIAISTPMLTIDGGLITTATHSAGPGSGRAGDIVLEVGRLPLTGGATIASITGGTGQGGTVQVTAADSMVISGHLRDGTRRSQLSTTTEGPGEAGRIVISTPTLTMDGGLTTALTRGSGQAGDIVLEVGRLILTGGAIIDSSTFGAGPGGTVTVRATESVVISGRASDVTPSHLSSVALGPGEAGRVALFASTVILDGGTIETSTRRDGRAGDIVLEVGRLSLTDGAQIDSRTRGVGRGGTVTIAATESIVIAGSDSEGVPSGLFSTTQGGGPGGHLHVAAPHIQLSNGCTLAASSSGDGAAGSILLQADAMFRSDRGRVTTTADRAGGGTIALTAGRLVQLIDSEISTSVRGGGGDAGNITIDPQFVILENSQIIANAFEGMGGNIGIDAGVFLRDPASLVSASSALGIQGTVDIRAPVTTLSGTLAPLPQAFVNVAALLPARCAARLSGGQTSSLVVGGRDGLPAEPSGVLPSPLALDERLVADPTVTGEPHRQKSAARFALLAGHEKGLPRLAGDCAK